MDSLGPTSDETKIRIACVQMQPVIGKVEANVAHSVTLIDRAAELGAKLVVLPELCNSGYVFKSREEAFAVAEPIPSGRTVKAWGEIAAKHKLHLVSGICERDGDKLFNSAVLIGPGGYIGTFRKVHLWNEENLYFEPGDLGFPVWRTMGGILGMCICNDRRWPETYRVMGLQGVELIVLGYNTPSVNSQKAEEGPEKRLFHHRLMVQAGAYQNSTWVVAVAKGGAEDGFPMIAGSIIVNPDGEIVAEASTEGDELLVHACDLDDTVFAKKTIFDFARHRRIEHYGLITSRTGAIPPP